MVYDTISTSFLSKPTTLAKPPLATDFENSSDLGVFFLLIWACLKLHMFCCMMMMSQNILMLRFCVGMKIDDGCYLIIQSKIGIITNKIWYWNKSYLCTLLDEVSIAHFFQIRMRINLSLPNLLLNPQR